MDGCENNGRFCCKDMARLTENAEVSDHGYESWSKLSTWDWLKDIPETLSETDLVEVRFKNTRKGYYKNTNRLKLKKGDIVAVEASPGHDIGVVSLAGALVPFQLKKISSLREDFRIVYRKAKQADIEKWLEAISLEQSTMLKARKIAADLGLDMKIGDVEYQGDRTKAIFYYIADERVDFRELIKVLADEFRVRIEMKQIGARQEAGRIGGIGPCGRELCCCTYINNFVSVTTTAARYQDLSLNPQKLAGQCGKLKCCLNYELDCYVDAQKDFPDPSIELHSEEGTVYHQKTDVFNRIMWYSFEKESAGVLIPLGVDRVNEIISLNQKGRKVKDLREEQETDKRITSAYSHVIAEESPDRFRKKTGQRRKQKKKRKGNKSQPGSP